MSILHAGSNTNQLRYKHIIFDLDGTIINPKEGIRNSFQYAMQKLGKATIPEEKHKLLIGPPLHYGFIDVLGLTESEADKAVFYFREYYGKYGLFESVLYPGIYDLLSKLSEAGVKSYLATSKLEKYAVAILKDKQIRHFFKGIAGASYKGKGADKDYLIRNILERIPLKEKQHTLMIGDTYFDIEGASKCGIDSMAVLYGFGDRRELIAAGATYIVNDIPHLHEELEARV